MFDGLKLRPNPAIGAHLRYHPLLKWNNKGIGLTGKEKFQAQYNNLIFKGDSESCYRIRGSLPKFFQGHNHQDLTASGIVSALHLFSQTFDIDPADLTMENIEIGVTITRPYPIEQILSAIILHQGVTALRMEYPGIEIEHDAYRIKIYDKSHQCQLEDDLIRVELAFNKMGPLKKYGLRTAADLMNEQTWPQLSQHFLKSISGVLIVTPDAPTHGLKAAQRQLVERAFDRNYWMNQKPRLRKERRDRLEWIYSQQGIRSLKETLTCLIQEKVKELFACSAEVCSLENRIIAPTEMEQNVKAEIEENRTNSSLVINHAILRNGNGAEKKKCLTCGQDISHQAAASKYCSEWRHGKKGKRCRNKGSNRQRTLKIIESRGPMLFDHTDYVKPIRLCKPSTSM